MSVLGPVGGLLLTPGASADRNQPALVAIDQAVSRLNVAVRRIDFGGRTSRPAALVATVVAAAADLAASAGVAADRIWLGGRSMGGRMCSMAVAEGLPARGLVLVSYPLHPPGRPQQLRTDHFPAIRVPCLFVSGTRDAFGTPSELEAATAAIPGPVTHHWIEGKDHGLRGTEAEVAAIVAGWIKRRRPAARPAGAARARQG